jgi:hypothetical protein
MDTESLVQLFIACVGFVGGAGCAAVLWQYFFPEPEKGEIKSSDEEEELLDRCDWQNELYEHIGSIEYIKRLESGELERVYYTSGKINGLQVTTSRGDLIEAGWKELPHVVWDDDFCL